MVKSTTVLIPKNTVDVDWKIKNNSLYCICKLNDDTAEHTIKVSNTNSNIIKEMLVNKDSNTVTFRR